MNRPAWNDIWMQVAETIAQRSHHPTFQVGAIVVTEDNTQVLSIGYNGSYKGGPNEPLSNEPGCSGLIHAEINALLKLDYNNPKKKKMPSGAVLQLRGLHGYAGPRPATFAHELASRVGPITERP